MHWRHDGIPAGTQCGLLDLVSGRAAHLFGNCHAGHGNVGSGGIILYRFGWLCYLQSVIQWVGAVGVGTKPGAVWVCDSKTKTGTLFGTRHPFAGSRFDVYVPNQNWTLCGKSVGGNFGFDHGSGLFMVRCTQVDTGRGCYTNTQSGSGDGKSWGSPNNCP